MTDRELQFFMGHEPALPLYAELRGRILALFPATEIRTAATQITFRERYGYAFVSTRRMGRGCPDTFINLSFGLGRELSSPRIFASSEPCPGRWTRHARVCSPADIDGELLGWIGEARGFALTK